MSECNSPTSPSGSGGGGYNGDTQVVYYEGEYKDCPSQLDLAPITNKDNIYLMVLKCTKPCMCFVYEMKGSKPQQSDTLIAKVPCSPVKQRRERSGDHKTPECSIAKGLGFIVASKRNGGGVSKGNAYGNYICNLNTNNGRYSSLSGYKLFKDEYETVCCENYSSICLHGTHLGWDSKIGRLKMTSPKIAMGCITFRNADNDHFFEHYYETNKTKVFISSASPQESKDMGYWGF